MSAVLHGPWIASVLNTALTSAKMKLWTSGTCDPDAHYMSDVDGTEASTTGYTSGFAGTAITLSGLSVAYNSSTNTIKIDGTAGSFTSVGIPAGYAVTIARIYIPVTTYADSPVIASFPCAASLNGGNFTVTINASGIGTISL